MNCKQAQLGYKETARCIATKLVFHFKETLNELSVFKRA